MQALQATTRHYQKGTNFFGEKCTFSKWSQPPLLSLSMGLEWEQEGEHVNPINGVLAICCTILLYKEFFVNSRIHSIKRERKVFKPSILFLMLLGRSCCNHTSIRTYIGHLRELGLLVELGFVLNPKKVMYKIQVLWLWSPLFATRNTSFYLPPPPCVVLWLLSFPFFVVSMSLFTLLLLMEQHQERVKTTIACDDHGSKSIASKHRLMVWG